MMRGSDGDLTLALGRTGPDIGEYDLTEAARGFLGWWVGELSDLLPARLKARATSRPAAIDAVLMADGRVAVGTAVSDRLPDGASTVDLEHLAARLVAASRSVRQKTLRLVVPRETCLLRHSTVPRRALSHAGAILRHEAETILPFPPKDILSDWFVETEEPGSGELRLLQVVLARPRIAAIEMAAAEAGLTLVKISVGDAQGRAMPVDLLGRGELSLSAALSRLSLATRLMGGAAILLVLATPFLATQRQAAELAGLAEERAAYRKPSPAGLSALALADTLDARQGGAAISSVLDDLALRLPAQATLTALRLVDGQLSLSIDAPDIGAVARALAESPLLHDVAAAPNGAPAVTATLRPSAVAAPTAGTAADSAVGSLPR